MSSPLKNLAKIGMILNKEAIKIIQITDTHLLKNDESVFGVDTNTAFKKIISNMKDEIKDAYAIFLTGDLSQDESLESYEIISNSLKDFDKPVYWIPGNHDSITNMHLVFESTNNFTKGKLLSTPLWDFIFLNTKQEYQESGFLADPELEFLQFELSKKRTNPVALVMHHHPIPVKTPLIDKFILENRDKLLEIIAQSQINLLICGHVHHDYSLRYGDLNLEASPATCFQFKKGCKRLSIENKIGYKIYHFLSNHYVTKTMLFNN